ncbi:MAG: hypothetical protein K2X81_29730, partial [Candidatus Obscuribacterales bacterium]|nr:hypothetical protein [Candidatus Obscuribacterales bacterium]
MADVALTRSDLLAGIPNPAASRDVLLQSVKEIPSAGVELAKEAWNHPVKTAVNALETTALGVAFGAGLGYFVPGRGPSAAFIGVAFSIPAVVGGYRHFNNAVSEYQRWNSDKTAVAHGLALDSLKSASSFVAGSIGGLAGSNIGCALARSEGSIGSFAQSSQRLILKVENNALSGFRSLIGEKKVSPTETMQKDSKLHDPNSKLELLQSKDISWSLRRNTLLSNRIDQFQAGENRMSMYYGSLHGHSVYSDGMDLPLNIYKKGQSQGWDYTTITDHNHTAARAGVPTDDPRYPGHQKTTTVADDPIHYTETINVAKQATENGKFVALYGVEVGTIGKPGSASPSGVNHINIFQTDTYYQSVKQPRPRISELFDPIRNLFGFAKQEPIQPPVVVKIPDGNYKALVDHLDQIHDATGGRPVVQLNHPRYAEDESPSLPKSDRGRDYGQKSFRSRQEWVDRFGKYASQLEIISGDAIKQDSSGEILAKHIHAEDFAGYIDKGLRISPTFGRDFHYGDPGGTKAATGILANKLDAASLLDALRARRTIATTNFENLNGNMVVNNVHPMGSVLDQTAVQDLSIKVNVAGKITPEAQYTAILWADKRIGDGKLATQLQTIKLSGKELIDAGNQISFDQVRQTLGVKSAYYAEVQRLAPVVKSAAADTTVTAKPPFDSSNKLPPDVELWLSRSTIPTFGTESTAPLPRSNSQANA